MSSIIAKPLRRQSQRWHSSFAVARWRSEPLRSNLSDWLLLLFPGMVACHYKCSLPAQFPMKSVDTAAIDGLGLVPATAMTFSTVRRRQPLDQRGISTRFDFDLARQRRMVFGDCCLRATL
jgi:hypothetical protein